MNKYPVLYRVWRGNRPCVTEAAYRETEPHYADMLRYDRAFHHPNWGGSLDKGLGLDRDEDKTEDKTEEEREN